MRAFLLASSVGLIGLIVGSGAACGGSVETESEVADANNTTIADGDTTVTDSSIGTEDGSAPSTDGSIPSSDGSTPSTDGGPPSTDGGTPVTPAIKCGSASCDPATQECCVGLSGAKCVAKGGCGGGSTFTCSDSSGCAAGQVCCAERTTGAGAGASCKATCSGVVLCSKDAECKTNERCVTGLAGFKFCRQTMTTSDGGFGGWDGGGFGGWDGGGFGGWDGGFGG